MFDLTHWVGNDINLSPTGDLSIIDGTVKDEQRILRRLLTNPGDLLFHPEYGAGLPQWIGKPLDIQAITALIRGQMFLEESVAHDPEPVITISTILDGISCRIQYADSATGQTKVLSFNVNL
ncbi:MAG: phage tail protein [Pseudomonadota bacterium]|nr:phage tail protein [Pseudomonadota bacterium]